MLKMKECTMADYTQMNSWWQKELHRNFTGLECGLLGALFAALTIVLLMLIRFEVG
jgi:hypothetical protein